MARNYKPARQIIVENLPFASRDEMLDLFCPDPREPHNYIYKRHSIMDAFRRLKLDGTVEEWCNGTITLAGHCPTND